VHEQLRLLKRIPVFTDRLVQGSESIKARLQQVRREPIAGTVFVRPAAL